MVWPWRINKPFTHHISIISSITIRIRDFKFPGRCGGIATKTCRSLHHTLYVRTNILIGAWPPFEGQGESKKYK